MSVAESERDDHDGAAQSFQELWAEVTVMRKAVERLEPTLEAMKPEDYTPTFGRVMALLRDQDKRLAVIEASPALRLGPEQYGALMAQSSASVMHDVIRPLHAHALSVQRSSERLEALWGDVADGRALKRQRWLFGLAGVIAGFVLFAVLLVLVPQIASVLAR